MPLIFSTDYHIGLKRTANTTPASRLLLQQALFDAADSVLSLQGLVKHICLGDLFDQYSNDEAVILQGNSLLQRLEFTLAGNHDLENREAARGSLELLGQLTAPDRVVSSVFGEVGVFLKHFPSDHAYVTAVPHVSSQALFDLSLDKAVELAGRQTGILKHILLLHCNYDSPFAVNDTSLNLTEERAKQLLERFDYILLGHEHQPRDLFGGRLIIIGNLHPTGFADISDKRYLKFEDGKMTSHWVWRAADGYLAADAHRVPLDSTASFIRITGEVTAEGMGAVTKSVATLWKSCPNLLGVKLDVEVIGLPKAATEAVVLEGLPETIERELQGTELLPLWIELSAEAAS